VKFETLGFDPGFVVELEPEFPGNGDWRVPTFGYDRMGNVVEAFESRWGTPLVLTVKPDEAADWVGMFAAGGLGELTGVFACPGANDMCVVAAGEAYLVDVTRPANGAVMAQNTVCQVLRVARMSLLLLVRPWDIVAVGPAGITWRTQRLAVDDLRVEQADETSIVCTCDNLGGTPTIEVQTSTGIQISGTPLDFPPHAR
jgi:hypothetical protein